ncbi:PsbP-related protein [Iningainema tapete]|uniref:Uncharacterized protein n=1 Tax=Iningainema tapete BLCC-T55 TaxID=2748662 RepID=A0A8J6XDB2_9CYAN|nr:PsbP-related protein [Iningainema tapete]MBD2773840.1 hypothetical protein [Iningainema tapete BLCC-T55]
MPLNDLPEKEALKALMEENPLNPEDILAWKILKNLLLQDTEGRALLAQLKTGEEISANSLKQWIRGHSEQIEPKLETTVSDSQLDKIINIARAETIVIQQRNWTHKYNKQANLLHRKIGVSLLSIILIIAVFVLVGTFIKIGDRLNLKYFFNNPSVSSINFLTYRDSSHNLAIKYPEDWVYQKINDPFTHEVVAFIPSSEAHTMQEAKAELIITHEKLSQTLTLSNYVNKFINQLKKDRKFSELRFLQKGDTTFGNRPAYGIIYTAQIGARNWKFMEVVTLKNAQAYLITYKGDISEYSRYYSTNQAEITRYKKASDF